MLLIITAMIGTIFLDIAAICELTSQRLHYRADRRVTYKGATLNDKIAVIIRPILTHYV